jgi:hypothetical protein
MVSGALYPTFAIHQTSLTTYMDLREWINTWRPTFIRSVKDARAQGVTQQQAIDLYFLRLGRSLRRKYADWQAC